MCVLGPAAPHKFKGQGLWVGLGSKVRALTLTGIQRVCVALSSRCSGVGLDPPGVPGLGVPPLLGGSGLSGRTAPGPPLPAVLPAVRTHPGGGRPGGRQGGRGGLGRRGTGQCLLRPAESLAPLQAPGGTAPHWV